MLSKHDSYLVRCWGCFGSSLIATILNCFGCFCEGCSFQTLPSTSLNPDITVVYDCCIWGRLSWQQGGDAWLVGVDCEVCGLCLSERYTFEFGWEASPHSSWQQRGLALFGHLLQVWLILSFWVCPKLVLASLHFITIVVRVDFNSGNEHVRLVQPISRDLSAMWPKHQLAGNPAREFATFAAAGDPTLITKMCQLVLVRNECCLFPSKLFLLAHVSIEGVYPLNCSTQHKVWDPSFLPHHAHRSSLGGGGHFHYNVDAWQGQKSGLSQDRLVPYGEPWDWKAVCSLKPIHFAINLQWEFGREKVAVIVQRFHRVLQRILAKWKKIILPFLIYLGVLLQVCLGG